jgi:hypothetical protein
MTVPLRFRRNSEIPRVLVLHYADIPESDIEMVHGVRVTKPMRTILDLLEQEEMPIALLRQALQEGLRRGIIRRGEIAEATWRGVKVGSGIMDISISSLKKVTERGWPLPIFHAASLSHERNKG